MAETRGSRSSQTFYRRGNAEKSFGYNETLMYGHYTSVLSKFARLSARNRLRIQNKTCGQLLKPIARYHQSFRSCHDLWLMPFGSDWIFLTSLGIVMALVSFGMDLLIERCYMARKFMFEAVSYSVHAQYFMWILCPMVLVAFSTGFTHLVGPHAIGSGIPEVKTIMRGVTLKEYLSFNTFVAKVVGLSTALGSGLPIGKEGPFVHVASISAALLSRLFSQFKIELESETRSAEVLAAACAVGVACTFAAPIGGVLFSIEVTATYFAVRNYWRGFYSAICGAVMFRFLAIWFRDEATLTALFKTNLRHDKPFVPVEIVSFSTLGAICGIGGVLFIFVHKSIVQFVRSQKKLKALLQMNRFIYPCFATFVILTVLFPPGLGQYMAGMLTNNAAVNDMFGNTTWNTREAETYEEERMLRMWRGPWDNVFLTLSMFIFVRFWLCALATTLPIPCGIFIPSFALGAACGRLFGEILAALFPNGIGGNEVIPGGYAIVGAASFSGSVTHTVSTAVIVFELTGQIGHVLPCVLAVFIANVISKAFSLSIYDTIVKIKKLPFLPSFIQYNDSTRTTVAEDFMSTDLEFITPSSSYLEVDEMLDRCPLKHFPIVESKENMILLGSVHRLDLERLIETLLSPQNRKEFLFQRDAAEIHNMPHKNGESITMMNAENYGNGSQHVVTHEKKPIGRFMVYPSEINENDEHEQEQNVSENTHLQNGVQNSSIEAPGEHRVRFKEPTDTYHAVEEEEWFLQQMNRPIDLDSVPVDQAPFQLIEKTSLYKVHSLFSVMNIHQTFVTKEGRLVGLICLEEVRNAVEKEINTKSELNKKGKMRCCSKKSKKDDEELQVQTGSLEEIATEQPDKD